MPDRNKVIEALEACVLKDPDDSRDCKHCPRCNYGAFITNSCINGVMADALALLKAQEPIKPYAEYSEHTGTKWLVCGACNEPMNKAKDETWSNYCPNCGRKVWYE